MRVGILGKLSKIKTIETMTEMQAFVQSLGYETETFTQPADVDGVDVVIVLGGDGAILHSALVAARKNIKIIGINYGNLGFLTEYEKNEKEQIKELLSAVENGTCGILKRSLLQLTVEGKTYYSLNEISLQREYGVSEIKPTQILKVEVQSKEGANTLSGDGLLICTPTGSTAYSLSAGGAILTPEVPVFMMTPICAFSMRARPIVFSDTDEFKLKIVKGKAIVLSDGRVVAALNEGAEIEVKKAPFTADFPVREVSGFFEKVRNKLNQ